MQLTRAELISAAERLAVDLDVDALMLEVGKRSNAMTSAQFVQSADLGRPMPYDSSHMGAIDTLVSAGKAIGRTWSREIRKMVCGGSAQDIADRKSILDALNISEIAVTGAVAAALMPLVSPVLAAAVAPLIVKRFVWPAKDQLCDTWLALEENDESN